MTPMTDAEWAKVKEHLLASPDETDVDVLIRMIEDLRAENSNMFKACKEALMWAKSEGWKTLEDEVLYFVPSLKEQP